MGLIARAIEKAGVSTVCITFRKDITELSRPPRIVCVKSSAGRPLGAPGDIRTQRAIIEAGFDLLLQDINGMKMTAPLFSYL